jgi:hypothetical protein
MWRQILSYTIKLNGLYDILCAISILDWDKDIGINIPVLKTLHLSMFLNHFVNGSIADTDIDTSKNALLKRIFAYWIFTYGAIRLFSSENRVIAYSYYIEAAVVTNELLVKQTMHTNRAYFVICSSIFLGYIVDICTTFLETNK